MLGEGGAEQKSGAGASSMFCVDLQLMVSMEQKSKLETSAVSFPSPVLVSLVRPVQNFEDCKQALDDPKDTASAEEDFRTKIVKIRRSLSVSRAVLHKKDFSALLRRQMTTSSSPGEFFTLRDVSKEAGRSFGTLYAQSTQKKTQRRCCCQEVSPLWYSSRSFQLLRSSRRLKQMCSDQTVTILKGNALFAYPVHVVSLSFTEEDKGSKLSWMYFVWFSARCGCRGKSETLRAGRKWNPV